MYPTYHFVATGPKPVAELWDDKTGVRVAIVVRSDDWPETDYEVGTPNEYHEVGTPNEYRRFNDMVRVSGSFLEAQAVAAAMVVVS